MTPMIDDVITALQQWRSLLHRQEVSLSREHWHSFLNDPQREKGGWIHKWTKVVYTGQSSSNHLTMQEQLQAHQKMWSEVWRETDQQVHLSWQSDPMVGLITREQIVAASGSFKRTTSTPDHFHPRWFGSLGSPAIAALVRLLALFEITGLTPLHQPDQDAS